MSREDTMYAEIGFSFRLGRILIIYIRRMVELGQLCATNYMIHVLKKKESQNAPEKRCRAGLLVVKTN